MALSLGRSEFHGIAKAATMGLCAKCLMEDLGIEVAVQVHTDSSVTKSIAPMRGAGRVRRIEVRELWAQDRV